MRPKNGRSYSLNTRARNMPKGGATRKGRKHLKNIALHEFHGELNLL